MKRPNLGILWDEEVAWEDSGPFQIKNLDRDYAKYTELGRERGVEFYVARFEWYRDAGLEKAWHWNGEGWEKVRDVELDGVFDKYRFDEETRGLKYRIAEQLPVLNHPELEEICKDKLKTHELFPEHVPETRTATEENARDMLERYDMIVFKPRFGASGAGVEFVESIEEFEEPDEPGNFIVQRFVEAGEAPGTDISGPHDMRTHVLNGELLEGNYVRKPREGLQSNISQGGTQVYIDNSDIPGEARQIIEEVSEEFSRFDPHLFSVDFMWDSNGGVWLVELNSKPAMYYHYPVKEKEHELPRIEKLVGVLADMVSRS